MKAKARGKNKRFNPYRRVRVEGGSAVITMGTLIPLDWNMVKIEVIKPPTETERVIKITKQS